MAKPWEKKLLNSTAWQRCRTGYIDHRVGIDGGLCEVCRESLGYIVHHKIQLTPLNVNDPTVALNWGNLSYECKACHDQHPGHGLKRRISAVCAFDSAGNPVGIYPEFEHDRL